MRIKVVTSINVRSSPFASPKVVIHKPTPEPEHADAILENISLAIPSLTPGRMDRFIVSQRIPRGSRLSGWLHGSSVPDSDRRKSPIYTGKTFHTSTHCFATAEGGHQRNAPGIRSYPSTRGLIDPVHSPTFVPRQLTHGSDPRHDVYLERLRAEMGSLPRKNCDNKKHHQRRPKRAPAKNARLCLPKTKSLKMRQKIIGCLLFGTLLIMILTTCESFHADPNVCYPAGKHLLINHRPCSRNI